MLMRLNVSLLTICLGCGIHGGYNQGHKCSMVVQWSQVVSGQAHDVQPMLAHVNLRTRSYSIFQAERSRENTSQ